MSLVIKTGAVVYFYLPIPDAWVPYGCARSGDINISTDFLEVTGNESGRFKDFLPVVHSYTGSLEGLHNLGTPGMLSIADLQEKQLAFTKMLMRFDYTAENGETYIIEGNFYISGSRINHSFDNVSTFNIDLQGTGALTQEFTPTPIIRGIVIRKQFLIPAGADDVTIPDIDGLDPENILLVTANGYNYEDLITAGIPQYLVGGAQVLYESAGGKLGFPAAAPVDTNGVVLYQTIISGS